MRRMCFISYSSMFQFIVLLFYNIIIIHAADFSDMLIIFCFCNTYFLLMNICLLFVPYNLQKLQSWIIYRVHVHVHILQNKVLLALFLNLALYTNPYMLLLAYTRNDGVSHQQKPHHNNVLDINVRMEHDC